MTDPLAAISLAGQLQLDNLVLVYDDNQVTCDGPLDWINVENTNDKFRACGWEVIDVEDGTYNVQNIVDALRKAASVRQRPVMVHVKTVIGAETQSAGTYKAHHGTIELESLDRIKALLQASSVPFSVPSAVSDYFQPLKQKGVVLQKKWEAVLERYEASCPQKSEMLRQRMSGGIQDGFDTLSSLSSTEFDGKATRETNGYIISQLSKALPQMFVGGADLINSMKITYSEDQVFDASKRSGNYIRYGIREHAMAAVANGLAAYHPGTFLPVTATFFMFYLYVGVCILSCGPVPTDRTTGSACGKNGRVEQTSSHPYRKPRFLCRRPEWPNASAGRVGLSVSRHAELVVFPAL